jgi:hypothetical protein
MEYKLLGFFILFFYFIKCINFRNIYSDILFNICFIYLLNSLLILISHFVLSFIKIIVLFNFNNKIMITGVMIVYNKIFIFSSIYYYYLLFFSIYILLLVFIIEWIIDLDNKRILKNILFFLIFLLFIFFILLLIILL